MSRVPSFKLHDVGFDNISTWIDPYTSEELQHNCLENCL